MCPDLKRWYIGQLTSEYLRRMETLLALYAHPYDPRFPGMCFDEQPCFLLGDVVEGLAPQPAKPGKQDQLAKHQHLF